MAIIARIHGYELDITKGSSKAGAWNARNRQRPAALIAPIMATGLLKKDIALPQNESRASITLSRGRVDARRGGCYKEHFKRAA